MSTEQLLPWSHDGTAGAVFDLVGNVWEWSSRARIVDGAGSAGGVAALNMLNTRADALGYVGFRPAFVYGA